jgi:hypothetical protein
MNTIRRKHIVIGLVIIFILFLLFTSEDEDYSYEFSKTQTQIPQLKQYYQSLNSEQSYPLSSALHNNPTNLQRHEILQTKVKGYREETFWGEQSSTVEKARHLNDDEFDRYIEELVQNDSDAFWGAEY